MTRSWIAALFMTNVFFGLTPSARAEQYVRPIVALTSMDGFRDAYAAGIAGGWFIPEVSRYLSLEGEFNKSFSKLENNTIDRTFLKAAAYAALQYPIIPRVQIKGKIGLHYLFFKDSGAENKDTSNAGPDYGIGVLYFLRRDSQLVAEYTTNDENDFTQLSLGLQISF